MVTLMGEVEASLRILHKYCSMVMGNADMKRKAKWLAELDICLISKIFNTPKNEEGMTVAMQEVKLRDECASLIATKVAELQDKDAARQADALKGENALVARVRDHLGNPRCEDKASENPTSAVAVPRIVAMDKDGKPVMPPAIEVAQPQVEVEVIPWKSETAASAAHRNAALAKSMLMASAFTLVTQAVLPEIAVIRKAGKVSCKAASTIPKGALQIPLALKKQESMVVLTESATVTHPHAVKALVSWSRTEGEILLGMEDSIDVVIQVTPELKLPKKVPGKELEWTSHDSAAPFWAVRRQSKVDDKWNCEIVRQKIVTIVARSPSEQPTGGGAAAAVARTFTATVPTIVNTTEIEADKEIVLKWQVLAPPAKTHKDKTWVSVIQQSEKKRLKLKQ